MATHPNTRGLLARAESDLRAAARALAEAGEDLRFEVEPGGFLSIVDSGGSPHVQLDVPPIFGVARPEGVFALGGPFPATDNVACVLCRRKIGANERMVFEIWREGRPTCAACAGREAPLLRLGRAVLATAVHLSGSVHDPAIRRELGALLEEIDTDAR